jgi:ribosomal protein S18 acetylase RimI-like enzyme
MPQINSADTPKSKIIKATQEHYDPLANFLSSNHHVHRHLDWLEALEWLGSQPYLIEISNNRIQSVFCATQEVKDIAWIRVFGVKNNVELQQAWENLLSHVVTQLKIMGTGQLTALALHPWFEQLLISADFKNPQNIVVLEWQGDLPQIPQLSEPINIRPMQAADLKEVLEVDHMAFAPVWQNSLESLRKAFEHPGICTVALLNDEIVGYQISTAMTIYGHLARLAVIPGMQRHGIGLQLVHHLLSEFKNRGFLRVTVNTQSDNQPSLQLYRKFGFRRTLEEIPVYQLDLFQP